MSSRPMFLVLAGVAAALVFPAPVSADEVPSPDALLAELPVPESLTPSAGTAVDSAGVALNELAVDASGQSGSGSSPPGPEPVPETSPGEIVYVQEAAPAADAVEPVADPATAATPIAEPVSAGSADLAGVPASPDAVPAELEPTQASQELSADPAEGDGEDATASASAARLRLSGSESSSSSSPFLALSPAQVVGATTVAAAAAASGGLGWHHRRRWWPGLLALVHRLDPRRIRHQAVRRRILEVVQAEPGIHMGALRRLLGLQSGHLRHHLKILEDSGALVSKNGGRYRCYFPDGAAAARWGRSAGALKAARARHLLAYVLAHPGHSVQEAEAAMGAPEGGLDYHLRRLEEMDLMLTMRSAGRRWLFPTSAAQEAGALMEPRPTPLVVMVPHAV